MNELSSQWHAFPCQQQPTYQNKALLDETLATLKQAAPLICSNELVTLQRLLAKASSGEAFVLQGGNCAELFSDCQQQLIIQKLMMLRCLSLFLESKLNKPVIPIGRIAGQYAKPRTVLHEIRGEISLPSYRGDLINQAEFNAAAREPDPKRLLLGYQAAAKTMQYICDYLAHETTLLKDHYGWQRLLTEAKPLELELPLTWQEIIKSTYENSNMLAPIYTSHEALLLAYEAALTRNDKQKHYNAGTHFPWIGMRTSSPDKDHILYAAGIDNPIAVKIGTQVNADYLIELVKALNPKNQAGRLTLIHRFGREYITELLPPLIKAANHAKYHVTWICDPMHGNIHYTTSGIKTRHLHDIIDEMCQAIEIHRKHGSVLAGLHIEMTEEHVTECLGGQQQLTEVDLSYGYKSLVDPRLNYGQALELLAHFAGNY